MTAVTSLDPGLFFRLPTCHSVWARRDLRLPLAKLEKKCICMYVCMYGWMDGWMDGFFLLEGLSLCRGHDAFGICTRQLRHVVVLEEIHCHHLIWFKCGFFSSFLVSSITSFWGLHRPSCCGSSLGLCSCLLAGVHGLGRLVGGIFKLSRVEFCAKVQPSRCWAGVPLFVGWRHRVDSCSALCGLCALLALWFEKVLGWW